MKTILIVDDEEPNRFYLETLFKTQGFRVIGTANGVEALEAARNNPPDIIISDILMPVMDGFMLCKACKNDATLNTIPFIFYTATYTDAKDEKLAMELGADLFLVKPQEPDVLLDVIHKFSSDTGRGLENKLKTSVSEEKILKEYNESLFRKLEAKIKQLEKANQSISKSESKYRSIFQNSLSGIFQISKEGKLLISNPALHHMLGYDSADDFSASITDIATQVYVKPDDQRRLIKLLKESDCVDGYETMLRKKDGSILWIKANIWTVRDENRRILFYEGIVEDISDRILKEETLIKSSEKLKNAMMETINIVSTIVEQRDPSTAGHQQRVAELASAIAEALNFPPHKIEGIRVAGLIHDVGKIAIPSEILTKPCKLSPIEMGLVKLHANAGFDILKNIDFPWPISRAIQQHHERMNGSGYPSGLSGGEIIPEARILAVADVVEAMLSHRPYRPGLGIDKTMEEIESNKGILYDERVVDACVDLFCNKSFKFSSNPL